MFMCKNTSYSNQTIEHSYMAAQNFRSDKRKTLYTEVEVKNSKLVINSTVILLVT